MSSNIADSVKARLLNEARGSGTEFELSLVRYACERFLYRLGESEVRNRCILKGATLLALWMKEPYRATRDIDLLAFGESDEETVRTIIKAVCSVPCEEDGITFDLDTLRVSPIRDNQRYQGQRANLRARLGTARIAVQVDFGFGNAVTPVVDEERLPTLIGGIPAPIVRTYPRVATIAEKFETMVQLGTSNSRMKDFYDVWALSETFAFDGAETPGSGRTLLRAPGDSVESSCTRGPHSGLLLKCRSTGPLAILWTGRPTVEFAAERVRGDRQPDAAIHGTCTRKHPGGADLRKALARRRTLAATAHHRQ